MKVSITINGVLRNVFSKFEEVYEKYQGKEVISPITHPNLLEFTEFKDSEELLDFLYSEAPMEVFGQAREEEHNIISHLCELYKEMPSNYRLRIVSDELGKAKSATLWFLAKYGVLCDEIIFYSTSDIKKLWKETDLFITEDKDIIKTKPKNKKLIIIDKSYNKDDDCDLRINNIKELKDFESINYQIETT